MISSIPDRRTREYALQNLNSSLFSRALNAGNVAEMRRLAAQMTNKPQQISCYTQIFSYALQKGEDKLARQILDEAASLVAANPENNGDMRAIFQLAGAYSSIAPDASLSLIEPTFTKFNELLNASLLLNRFAGSEQNRHDEITSQFFHGTLGQYGFYFNQNDWARLATANFERVKNLGDGFQRPEARLFLRLMIVQAILSQIRQSDGDNAVYKLRRGDNIRPSVLTVDR